ncbi:uncharacterized protein LOC142925706 [Petromyzon marinus]|uniref:uncharacterized protein LOC142925706 n=1 Tax=Petromyzon marinus TaxID=7757 RepID=UPI003F6FE9A8
MVCRRGPARVAVRGRGGDTQGACGGRGATVPVPEPRTTASCGGNACAARSTAADEVWKCTSLELKTDANGLLAYASSGGDDDGRHLDMHLEAQPLSQQLLMVEVVVGPEAHGELNVDGSAAKAAPTRRRGPEFSLRSPLYLGGVASGTGRRHLQVESRPRSSCCVGAFCPIRGFYSEFCCDLCRQRHSVKRWTVAMAPPAVPAPDIHLPPPGLCQMARLA